MYQITVIFQFLFAFTTVYSQWRGSSMSSPQAMFGNKDRSVGKVNSFGEKNSYNFKQNLNWNSPINEQPSNLADQYLYSNEKNVFSGLSNLKPNSNFSPNAKWNSYTKNNEDSNSLNSGKNENYEADNEEISNSGYFGQNSISQSWQLGEKEKKFASSANSNANSNSIQSFNNNDSKYFLKNENSKKSPANNQNSNIFITPSNNLILENTDDYNNEWIGNNKKKSESTKNSNWVKSESNNTNVKYQNWLNNKKDKTDSSKKPESNVWKTSSPTQKPFGNDNSEKGNISSNKQKDRAKKDLSILDELDKNDWYFGSEEDFPEIDSYSNINIDVSKLWDFDKKRGLDISKKRKNREVEVNCKCVDINLCNEEDMIVSKEDIGANNWRLIDLPKCERLTEVCCTRPKSEFTLNFQNRPYLLECGQRSIAENLPEKSEDNNFAFDGEFPWALSFENLKDGSRCGASLVHPRLAVTAAHCVIGTRSEDLIIYTALLNDESVQQRSVSKIIVHPSFSEENPRNDIALLLMETPFKLTNNVNAICLPVTNDKWFSNRCFVAGWSLRGDTTKILQKGMVNFMPQNECQNILLNTYKWHDYVLHNSFVCATEENTKTPCLGDEGSAVMCPSKKFSNTYLQIGIVSKSLNCNELGQPGIFTNILKFLDWINKYIFEMEISDAINARRVY